MKARNIKKIYYSISEVSRITSVRKHILRSWEVDFPDLKPGKNRAGNRIYRLNDVKTIFLIKRLLHQEKYTVEGAKQKLRMIKKNHENSNKLSLEDLRKSDALLEIRQELHELLDFISNTQGEEQTIESSS